MLKQIFRNMEKIMNTISINGNTITTTGNSSIVSANGKIYVNGKDVTPDSKEITIEVHGDINKLEVDNCHSLTVSGNVGSVSTISGDVECGPITGGVKTVSGDVCSTGRIGGSVSTVSGDVN